MNQSQHYKLLIETEITCLISQGHMFWDILLKQLKILGTYRPTILTPLTFMQAFSRTAFSFHFLDCFGTCLCCDNQGWLSWINYTVEVNFPFEVLTIPNVLESVISFAKEIFLFGNVGSFSTLLFWQHYADLIRTRAIGNLGRQRDVKPILC